MAKIYSITDWQNSELVPTDALEYWHALQSGATGNDIVYDYSGNNRHLSAASPSPVLQADVLRGHLGMYFDGEASPLKNDENDLTLNHIFILAAFEDAAFAGNEGLLSDTGTLPVLLGNGAASVQFFDTGYDGTYRKNDEVFDSDEMSAPMSGNFALIEIVFQPGLPFEGWQIGQDRSDDERRWKGWFIEDLAYSRVLTKTERRRVLLYFCLRFWMHKRGLPLWFPSSDLTNILYHFFDDEPERFEDIIEDFTYADKGKDFNEVSDTAPLRWEIQHLRRLKERVIIFDAFWRAARLVNSFFFRDKYGDEHSGVLIENYSRAHEAHKSWKKDVVFKLVKHPYSDVDFPVEIDYDLTPPATPEIVSANASSSSTIHLIWQPAPVDDVDHYEMRFKVGAGSYGVPVTVEPAFEVGGYGYTHGSLDASTLYTYQIRAIDAFGNATEWSDEESETTPAEDINVALAANGSTATASSTSNPSVYSPAGCINGYRHTNGLWTTSPAAGWDSAGTPSGGSPEWLQVDFGMSRTINEINVFTLRDSYNDTSTVTLIETFSLYGVTDYKVQYWNGAAWTDIATVTANDKIWRQFTFSPVTTTKIRVLVTGTASGAARLTEVEAWGF